MSEKVVPVLKAPGKRLETERMQERMREKLEKKCTEERLR